jgi:hypothetical protein
MLSTDLETKAPPPHLSKPSSELPITDGWSDIDRLVSEAVAFGDFAGAVSMLQSVLVCDPQHEEALLKLLDVAVDGGLPRIALETQEQLCALRWEQGQLRVARDIARDILAREPREVKHRIRLERILAALCETGDSAPGVLVEADAWISDEPFELVREELIARAVAEADVRFAKAVALDDRHDAGAEFELEAAAGISHLRFEAASRLARNHVNRCAWGTAADWLEWATPATSLAPDAGHALAYEIAGALESAGEDDRALTIYGKLQTEAGAEYRDLALRVSLMTCH